MYRALDMRATGEGTADGEAVPGPPAPVVLKLMRNRDQFERERDARAGLDHEHVVQVLATSDDEGLRERWVADAEARGWAGCAQGLVMEAGDRNLMSVLLQERVTLDYGMRALKQLALSLGHLHDRGLVHCDFKPLNAVRVGAAQTWQLIDFDATVKVGGCAGAKSSTGYCPPELLHRGGGEVGVRAWVLEPGGSGGGAPVPKGDYELLRAAPTFDVWSLGAVAFHLYTVRVVQQS